MNVQKIPTFAMLLNQTSLWWWTDFVKMRLEVTYVTVTEVKKKTSTFIGFLSYNKAATKPWYSYTSTSLLERLKTLPLLSKT